MHIIIGADHGGFDLKTHICAWASAHGHHVTDVGTMNANSCDYPDVVTAFAKVFVPAISDDPDVRGVLVCGSGQGVCMGANRFPQIRAALCRTVEDAELTRAHNDANVLCLGGRVTPADLADSIVGVFLTTAFSGERHARRVTKLEQLAKQVHIWES